jgi:hypothetical protein
MTEISSGSRNQWRRIYKLLACLLKTHVFGFVRRRVVFASFEWYVFGFVSFKGYSM